MLHSTFNDYILLLVPSHKNGWCGMKKEEVKRKTGIITTNDRNESFYYG